MNISIKLEVFGKKVLAQRTSDRWNIYYLSEDGKRRPAHDIHVPRFIDAPEIERYLADLCHEWATEKYPVVRRID